ncbi:hypothetical protein [Amycolatopsis acidicola]|nr:hypothetical protein [Amycolatopsis acidicola]
MNPEEKPVTGESAEPTPIFEAVLTELLVRAEREPVAAGAESP